MGVIVIFFPSGTSPSFIYKNFGETPSSLVAYWTMTPVDNQFVWEMHYDSYIYRIVPYHNTNGVRPVINLLKSAITQ